MQFALFADEAGGAFGFILVAMLWFLGFLLYIAPSIIAFTRGHPNAVPILLINVFLGWICLAGWFWALVWAFTNPQAASASPSRRRRLRRLTHFPIVYAMPVAKNPADFGRVVRSDFARQLRPSRPRP